MLNDLNFYFGILGVLGTLVGIYSFFQQSRSRKIQTYIFNKAQEALEKESTEIELKESKIALKEIEIKLETMQAQIEKDIPIQAKKAVLSNKLSQLEEALIKTYKDFKEVREKVKEFDLDSTISNELLSEIENEVVPRNRINNSIALSAISGISLVVLAVISLLSFPPRLANIVGNCFFCLSLFPILYTLWLFTLRFYKDKQVAIKKFYNRLFFVALVFSALCFWQSFYSYSFGKINFSRQEYLLYTITFAAIALFLIVGKSLHKDGRFFNSTKNSS